MPEVQSLRANWGGPQGGRASVHPRVARFARHPIL